MHMRIIREARCRVDVRNFSHNIDEADLSVCRANAELFTPILIPPQNLYRGFIVANNAVSSQSFVIFLSNANSNKAY